MNEINIAKSAIARVDRAEDGKQIVILPKGFELPEGEVTIREQDGALIIERRKTLIEALDQMEPLTEEEWPDITDDDLLPLRDIKL